MKTRAIVCQLWIVVSLALGSMSAFAVDGTWIKPAGFLPTWLWLVNTNWSGSSYPGEINNAASLNTDVATITNATPSYPVIQIDFSASGANGQLGLGAIIVDRTSFSGVLSATIQPVVNGGALTLNGAIVNGVPNTILGNRGAAINDNFSIGAFDTLFDTLRLGSLTNVIQMGQGKRTTVSSVISERNAGSGMTLTSDGGELLPDISGGFSASLSNTFTGPVRIEKGARWNLGSGSSSTPGNPQALGLSPPDAANLVLDNGVLRARTIQIGRLFTLGPGGGRLEAGLGVSHMFQFAFTNTGVIGFEGVGPRTLTLASDNPMDIVSRYGLIAPSIGDAPGGGKTSLVKTNESSIWILTGSNTYSGATTINQGSIELRGNGSFANSPAITLFQDGSLAVSGVTGGANHDGARFALASGQTLEGNGSVYGAMSVRGGATLKPGLGLGTLSARHLVFTAPSAALEMEADLGSIPAADLLQIANGGIDAGGATLNLSLLNAPVVPGASQTFVLITNDGSDPITNQFGAVNLSGLNAGSYQVAVDYAFTGTDSLGRVGNGNDLAITLAPATASSPLSLSISVANGLATLTWPSVSNQTYWVQYKSALTNSNWDELTGEVVATGPTASKTDPIGPEPRFYRVRTQ